MGLFACSDSAQLQQDLQDYQQRLANVLKIPAPSSPSITPLAYPSSRQLHTPLASPQISLSELYALSDCAVAVKIAQRNTPLGRTQYPSTRYIYEVELIDTMKACLATVQEPANRQSLERWLASKSQNLPLVWADLIHSSEEIRRALGGNQGLIQGNAQDGLGETQAALQYLVNLYKHPQAQSQVLEAHLKALNKYQLPARLWRSELLLSAMLTETTRWLEHKGILALCPQGKASQQVDYLNNVFRLFFIEKIQVIASKIDHYHYQLSPMLEQLLKQPGLNKQLAAFLSHHQTDTYKQYRLAMQNHIALWQALYRNCGLSPG